MKRILMSIGAGIFGAALTYLTIVIFHPTMYIERAGNIIVDVFIGCAVITAIFFKKFKRKA